SLRHEPPRRHGLLPQTTSILEGQQIYAIDGGLARVPLITDTNIYVTFEVTEPLLLSPLIFGSGYGKQGFYGIQSMNFQMVINGNANRAWRSARQITTVRKTATVVSYENSQLIFEFITPHSSDMLDPRNVVPYYELPVYKTTGFETLPSRPNWETIK
ncbi:MAG: phage major capsid domain-containing protein, partial [Candidatus Fonsibacter sp.]